MRMKMVTESQTLKDAAKEFLAYKKAQKIRERTLKDCHKYIDPFIAQSSNSNDPISLLWLLSSQGICVDFLDDDLNSKPQEQISKHFHNAAIIRNLGILQHGKDPS